MLAESQSWPAAGRMLSLHLGLFILLPPFHYGPTVLFFLDTECSSAGLFDRITGELVACNEPSFFPM